MSRKPSQANNTGGYAQVDQHDEQPAREMQLARDAMICNQLTNLALSIARMGDETNAVLSYDPNTREGCARRERHECDAQDSGASYVNRVLEIVAFTASRTELPDDNGEIKSVPVLTLETSAGELVNLFSAPALRCFISRLRTHSLDGPLNESHPIRLKLVQRATSGARKMYWLERP